MSARTHLRRADEGEFRLVAPGNFVRDLGIGELTGGELTAQVVVQQERNAEYAVSPRDGLLYRDFGLKERTGGRWAAHTIKSPRGERPPAPPHAPASHFRFVYVAEGWVESEFEDVGRIRLEKGAMGWQPPMIRSTELAYSDDVTIVEVLVPDRF